MRILPMLKIKFLAKKGEKRPFKGLPDRCRVNFRGWRGKTGGCRE